MITQVLSLRDYFRLSRDLYCELSPEGRFLFVNESWTLVLGWTSEEMVGSHFTDWLHPDDINPSKHAYANQHAGQFRNRYRHKDGTYRTLEWGGSHQQNQQIYAAHARDLSQREEDLRERFMALAEHMPLMLAEYDSAGRVLWANQLLTECMGWRPSEVRPLRFLHEASVDVWTDFRVQAADGRTIDTSWCRVQLSQGTSFAIGQDMTDRKLNEAKLIHSSKMASLGEMSAGVSHEINNPLAIIHGSGFRALRYLKQEPPDLFEVEADLQRVIGNCDRIARIVRGLRAFSRNVEDEPLSPTPINSIIGDVLDLAGEKLKNHGVGLNIDLQYDGNVNCRSVQLGQVLMNLINNAYDAVLKSPKAEIHVISQKLDNAVQIVVEDNGCGIPAPIRDRILEPFFTTKEVGKGTGLGLSISKGIVEAHHGRLWLDAESERTRFVIELPI